jgi:hypothetical protein
MCGMTKPVLKLDWCDAKAATYAVMKWHYSKTMPIGRTVKVGVWEDGVFIGVVLFSHGATPSLGKPYGMESTEAIELVRIALTKHKSTVSKILAIALRMLKTQSPNLKLVISFADTEQGHHGGIYQATNWVYAGTTKPAKVMVINGKRTHRRSYTGVNFGRPRKELPSQGEWVDTKPKHRYLMPLDEDTKRLIQPLSLPYPKRVRSADGGTSVVHTEGGGSNPTRTL